MDGPNPNEGQGFTALNRTRNGRRDDIQGLRAAAVTSVVLFHAGFPIPGGFTGVDIFFVISGFVITQMLMRDYSRYGRISLANFYMRRFKRLTPALALVVTTVSILSFLFLSPLNSEAYTAAATGLGSIFLISNIVISRLTGGYFEPAAADNPLLNTWSLSVEEQFYLFFPVAITCVLAIWHTKFRRELSLVAVICFVGIVSFVIATHGADASGILQKNSILNGFYSPFSRAWEFAAGAIVAVATGAKLLIEHQRSRNMLATTGLILVLVGFFFVTATTPFPGKYALPSVVGSMLLIYAGSSSQIAPHFLYKLLVARPAILIGDISYSWYLWHWPMIVFATALFGSSVIVMVITISTSVVVSYGSYHWVENPLRNRREDRKTFVKLASLTVSPALASCLLLALASHNGYWSDKVRSYQTTIDTPHASDESGCGQGFVPDSFKGSKCSWNSSSTGAPLYLIGDSNADHLSEALMGASRKLDRPLFYLTKGGCAFLGRSWSDTNDVEGENCTTFVAKTIDLLGRSPVGTVVLGLSDSLYYAVGASAVGPSRLEQSNDRAIAFPYLTREMHILVDRLIAKGNNVVLVKPVPKFLTEDAKSVLFSPSKCTTISVLFSTCPKRVFVSEEAENKFQGPIREAIDLVAQQTHAKVVDARPFFCPNRICSNYGPEGILYKNAGHLTVRASAQLSDLFIKAIGSD